jgi:hypothetical protein
MFAGKAWSLPLKKVGSGELQSYMNVLDKAERDPQQKTTLAYYITDLTTPLKSFCSTGVVS